MIELYLLMPHSVKNLHDKNNKNLKNNDIHRLTLSKSEKLEKYRKNMNNMINDDVIMELNDKYLSDKRDSLKTLLLCLNRQGILPLEVISKIKEYGLKLIVPRTNICDIITDDLVKAIYELYYLDMKTNKGFYIYDVSYNEKEKIMLRFDKYYYEKPEYYKFVKNVLLYGDIYKYHSRGKTFRRYYEYIWHFDVQ